ncbi:MAG: quinol:electron acceptor oxidoreductase subunit ActD, partial [Planctomycetota bacterium]
MSARRLTAVFTSEGGVLEATREARDAGFRVEDVYTPFPVHGMGEAMGLAPSRLGWVCFAFAATGAL